MHQKKMNIETRIVESVQDKNSKQGTGLHTFELWWIIKIWGKSVKKAKNCKLGWINSIFFILQSLRKNCWLENTILFWFLSMECKNKNYALFWFLNKKDPFLKNIYGKRCILILKSLTSTPGSKFKRTLINRVNIKSTILFSKTWMAENIWFICNSFEIYKLQKY